MLSRRVLILILAAVTVAGTSPQRTPADVPAEERVVGPRDAAPTGDPSPDGSDAAEKKKKPVIPANSLTGVWHRGGGEPGKVRPCLSSLMRPIWQWPALSRRAVHAQHVETTALPARSPRPQPVQPHAPPAVG